jgi:hypothetical protein
VLRKLVFAAILLGFPALAKAQTLEIETARAQAMGGAFRALGFDNSAIDLNPAGLGQFKKVEFTPGYQRSVDAREYAMVVSLSDSLTNAAGTGTAFEYRRRRSQSDVIQDGFESYRYVLAVGFPVIPDQAWVGVSTKYFKVSHDDPAIKDRTGFTSDLGILYRPMKYVALAGTFDNLVNGNQAEAPRSITGGIALLPTEWFVASGDVFSDLASQKQEKTGWALGAQLSPAPQFALRAGLYQEALPTRKTPTDDLRSRQYWTGGVGLISENGTIDYAFRIEDGGTKVISHFVTISFLKF